MNGESVLCHNCQSNNLVAWADKRREISFAKCRDCGRVRQLTGSEFGKIILAEIEAGRGGTMNTLGAALTLGGPKS